MKNTRNPPSRARPSRSIKKWPSWAASRAQSRIQFAFKIVQFGRCLNGKTTRGGGGGGAVGVGAGDKEKSLPKSLRGACVLKGRGRRVTGTGRRVPPEALPFSTTAEKLGLCRGTRGHGDVRSGRRTQKPRTRSQSPSHFGPASQSLLRSRSTEDAAKKVSHISGARGAKRLKAWLRRSWAFRSTDARAKTPNIRRASSCCRPRSQGVGTRRRCASTHRSSC